MIILDTNVLSAVMEQAGNDRVVNWLDRQDIDGLCMTAINLHELRFGIDKLARGRRRKTLDEALDYTVELLGNRVWPIDLESAKRSGELQARREKVGRPIALGDCLIAGVALARGAAIATRNVRHFRDLGIVIVNPWD